MREKGSVAGRGHFKSFFLDMLLLQNPLLIKAGEKCGKAWNFHFRVVPFSLEFRTERLKVTAKGKAPCTDARRPVMSANRADGLL
jgi:hypothetical protein